MIHLTKLLINYTKKHTQRPQREALSLLSGIVGITCNILLCTLKFVLGAVTGAVSVTADAINNLSDATVNIVTLAGTRLAGKPVDKEHPFGHGRAEYISALIVAFSVFIMSFELAKSAVAKILHPQEIQFSYLYLALLLVAAGVKLWMAYFNRRLYVLTDNLNMKAVMKDSLNDSIATGATAAVLVLAGIFHLQWVDGAVGCAVAAFVFFSGIAIVKDILGPLLGEPPSDETVNAIEDIILADDLILGMHDLIIHYYGPDRVIASAHAEVPADATLVAVHEVIDRAEKEIMERLHIDICLHTDPVATNDGETEKYKILTEIILSDYNAAFAFHDFRLSVENGKTVIAFDLVTPFEYENKKAQIEEEITQRYREKLPDTVLKLNIEHAYTVSS